MNRSTYIFPDMADTILVIMLAARYLVSFAYSHAVILNAQGDRLRIARQPWLSA